MEVSTMNFYSPFSQTTAASAGCFALPVTLRLGVLHIRGDGTG
jgi:hypothetical protein